MTPFTTDGIRGDTRHKNADVSGRFSDSGAVLNESADDTEDGALVAVAVEAT